MNATLRADGPVDLDAAGHGRMQDAVHAELVRWTRHEDRYGSHELEEHLEEVVRGELDTRLAALLGAPAGTVALSTGAAESYAAVLARLPLTEADRVWTTPYESAANLTVLFSLRDRTRCRLEVVPLGPEGDLDLEWMRTHIDDGVALVSVPQTPGTCGIVNPVEEVGRILAPYRCLYAIDAAHAVGRLPVDVSRTGCDLLTGDAWRYLGGPRSTGFAYVSPRWPQAQGGHPVDTGELPGGPAVAALNAALGEHLAEDRDTALGDLLRSAVERTSGTELIDPGRVRCGTVTFRHATLSAATIRRELAARAVVVRKSVAQETPLYLEDRGVTTAVQVSLHRDSSAQDVEAFAGALRDVVAGARRPAEVTDLRAVRTPAGALPASARRRAARHLSLVQGDLVRSRELEAPA
jgi:selenocysteine lyase/cysteine desulfurase